MATTSHITAYADRRYESEHLGSHQDARADAHRQKALHALASGEEPHASIVHALLAIEARIDELTCYVAQLG